MQAAFSERFSRRLVAPILTCAILLILFAVISYSAARTKNAVFDEPLHAVGGYIHRTAGDFRINPEDPALFGYWASLPHGDGALKIDYTSPHWIAMLDDFNTKQWLISEMALYETAGIDGEKFIQTSRLMFVPIGVLLGALIAWWSWQLGGAWAAIIATSLFAFDPNFLGHVPLVKNDVASSLALTALAMALWRFGRRGTWIGLAAIALLCAFAVNVKFSGILCGPIIFVVLLIRALLPAPWLVAGRRLDLRWQRLIVVPAVCVIVGIVSYVAIWACYGFRYSPTPDPNARLNMQREVWNVKLNRVCARRNYNYDIPNNVVLSEPPGAISDLVVWADSNRLLPQAWLVGFLHTYSTTIARQNYLLGAVNTVGSWYYFPLAMLFKTPTATLAAIPAALLGAIILFVRRRRPDDPAEPGESFDWWPVLGLMAPAGMYGTSAILNGMNIGLRHILPLYPFLFVAIGVVMALLLARWKRASAVIAGVIILGLAVESLAACPDFIAFFNTPSGGALGGFSKLGDSNLDWGQDLKLLAEWQKTHPKTMYLCYFGLPDPAFFGIKAIHMPWGWLLRRTETIPSPGEDCYIAISATHLQGINHDPPRRELYRPLRSCNPIAVLGGTIYIYESPFKPVPGRE